MKVTWDHEKNPEKARRLLRFEEASELFTSSADSLEIFDEAHSELEDRFISIGAIRRGLVLVVWTERDEDVVRIISARWATRREQTLFRDHTGAPNDCYPRAHFKAVRNCHLCEASQASDQG